MAWTNKYSSGNESGIVYIKSDNNRTKHFGNLKRMPSASNQSPSDPCCFRHIGLSNVTLVKYGKR